MSQSSFYVDVMSLHPEVTGSCNFCSVHFPNGETVKFVVDCGIFQELKYKSLNQDFTFDPRNLDFALVTHPHMDHIGRFPLLVKKGFNKEIYLTESCSRIFPVLLKDGMQIVQKSKKDKKEQPLYTKSDYQKTLSHLEVIKQGISFTPHHNIVVTFFGNGHIFGAATILVEIRYEYREPINLFFTGDYNDVNPFYDVEDIPHFVRNIPINFITESTYGAVDSDSVDYCFEKNIREAVAKNKIIIIPTFAFGRTQEILYRLKRMQNDGMLSKEIPIFLDGNLSVKITNIFLNSDDYMNDIGKDFLPRNMAIVDKEIREEIFSGNSGTKIIVTPSGTGSFGPANAYISHFLSDRRALIHFVGYPIEGTVSRKLCTVTEKGQTININGLTVVKRADVLYTSEFSSHARSDILIDLISKFDDVRFIMCNHGSIASKAAFASEVKKVMEKVPFGVLDREYFFRIHANGVIKSFPTKFSQVDK